MTFLLITVLGHRFKKYELVARGGFLSFYTLSWEKADVGGAQIRCISDKPSPHALSFFSV
jgi:hypothetical protein